MELSKRWTTFRKKFWRQSSIGKYIVDFYCPKEKLAIELDGEVHIFDKVYKNDLSKIKYLNEKGIHILRFENELVFKNLDYILKTITKYFKS